MATGSRQGSYATNVAAGLTVAAIAAAFGWAAASFSGDWGALRSVLLSTDALFAALWLGVVVYGVVRWWRAHRAFRDVGEGYNMGAFKLQAIAAGLIIIGISGLVGVYEGGLPPGHERLFD